MSLPQRAQVWFAMQCESLNSIENDKTRRFQSVSAAMSHPSHDPDERMLLSRVLSPTFAHEHVRGWLCGKNFPALGQAVKLRKEYLHLTLFLCGCQRVLLTFAFRLFLKAIL